MDALYQPATAHPDHLARKVIAAGVAPGTRAALIAACRAELDWAQTRYRRDRGFWVEGQEAFALSAEARREPVEHAAAAVVNAWGHLHPNEYRARALGTMILARRAHGWDVSEQRKDLRWYVKERVKLKAALAKAIARYEQIRRGL